MHLRSLCYEEYHSLVETQEMGLDKGQGHMGHTGCHEAASLNQSSKEVICAGGSGAWADVEPGMGNDQVDLGCAILEACLGHG